MFWLGAEQNTFRVRFVGVTVEQLSREALGRLDVLLDRIVPQLVALEPADFYAPQGEADLRAATLAGLERVLRALAGETLDVEAAQAAGRRQVQQDLPLEGVLRAYRVAGQTLWEDFVTTARRQPGSAEGLLDGATEVWRVIDSLSTAASEAYRIEESLRRGRGERVRSSVLAALLDGNGADPEFARDSARALSLSPESSWIVVVAMAFEPHAVALEAPLERLLARGITSTWLSTGSAEVGLVDIGSGSRSDVRGILAPGVRGRAGMSATRSDLAEIPMARRQAELAALSGPAGQREISVLDDDLVGGLAVESTLVAQEIYDRTVGVLLRDAGTDGPMLVATVAAFIRADGSLNIAADRTFVHRNTMLYRLNKVDKITGTKFRTLSDQVLWSIGLKIAESR